MFQLLGDCSQAPHHPWITLRDFHTADPLAVLPKCLEFLELKVGSPI